MKYRYTAAFAAQIEDRWQQFWAEHGTFRTPNPSGPLSDKTHPRYGAPKLYVMAMFPYLSGDGLHVGHPLGYLATDCYARYARMRGYNVLHPMGFDAFGLPAEQYAIASGVPPKVTAQANVARYRDQLRRLGMGYDDRRYLATADPEYYHWTQWTFRQIFNSWYDPEVGRARPIADLVEQFATGVRATPDGRQWTELSDVEQRRMVNGYRLAYLAEAPVNWCPELGTVLSDVEVTDDRRSERGDFPVYPRTLRQWLLRITAYADRLLADLDSLDWPEHVKTMQRNWIDRPEFRDWLFSRQRYWGEPFPIVYDEHGLPVALPEEMLPVELPDLADSTPVTGAGEPVAVLSRASDWVNVILDLGDGPRAYRRETNTMPQWAGSCWYHLRYLNPGNRESIVDDEDERHWLPVDLYVGGVDHAVGHLLYARFWHKVLYDLGHVSGPEPFHRLVNNGYLQAYAYVDERGCYVDATAVECRDGRFFHGGAEVRRQLGKMGKSLKNGVSPDDVCAEYGADTFRVFTMSMGPLEVSRMWDTRAIAGSYRLLQRVWRIAVDEGSGASRVVDRPADPESRRMLHRTIDAVGADLDALRFNTAIAKLTELTARVTAVSAGGAPRELVEPLVLMFAPFAPHLSEELWHRLGHAQSIAYADYPQADPALVARSTVVYPVQVNGKLRNRIELPADTPAQAVRQAAIAAVAGHLAGREPVDVIVVPGRTVNVIDNG